MRNITRFWGIVLLTIGTVFLIGNLTGMNVWAFFWPLALITLGIWLLWGATRHPESQEMLSIPLEGATQATVRLRYGAGRVTLAGGAPAGQLLAGKFGGGVIPKIKREADTLRVKLNAVDTEVISPIHFGTFETRQWDVQFNTETPLTLKLETGACEVLADLEALHLTELVIDTGASSTTVTLPARASMTRVRVGGGAASVKLLVPENVAASIHAHGGLSGINVDAERFPRVGERYISPNYDTAEHKVEINAEIGVGSITIV